MRVDGTRRLAGSLRQRLLLSAGATLARSVRAGLLHQPACPSHWARRLPVVRENFRGQVGSSRGAARVNGALTPQ